MAAQRHTVSIQKASNPAFVPYQVIPPQPRIAHHQLCREHTLCKQQYCTIVFDYPLILFPKRFKRYNPIPLSMRVILMKHLIRKVTANHVNTTVRNLLHYFQTVALNDFIMEVMFLFFCFHYSCNVIRICPTVLLSYRLSMCIR